MSSLWAGKAELLGTSAAGGNRVTGPYAAAQFPVAASGTATRRWESVPPPLMLLDSLRL